MVAKKRVPTPRAGAKGRAFDLCHRAWCAGLLRRWHLMENGTWSLDLGEGDGRVDDLFVADVVEMVEARLARAGVDSIVWGPMWCGYRSVIVSGSGWGTGELRAETVAA